eukprot:TRINITY_DN5739_c0_g1_i1.p1 TRINITY_DN5739_c0_g1~~TRINITY_DN5739_c0_g1_i1.p1  ORF type:complete len:302 (+),score=74.02 TRINITY_DN5739_c0_g1_i1:26-931(+)
MLGKYILLLAFAIFVKAQNVINAEGAIIAVSANPACTACAPGCAVCGTIQVFVPTLSCMITPQTFIHSPTGAITFAQLVNPTPFPGKTTPGFIGGTAIFAATQAVVGGPVVCDDIFVEVAENVLIGALTATPTTLNLQGVPLFPIRDIPNRITSTIQNDLGFPVNLATLVQGTFPTTAAGYGTPDGFYFHQLSIPVDGVSVAANAKLIGVGLARCRLGRTTILGGVRTPLDATTQVEVILAPNGVPDFAQVFGPIPVIANIAPFFQFRDVVGGRASECTTHVLVRVVGSTDPAQQVLVTVE